VLKKADDRELAARVRVQEWDKSREEAHILARS